ncbi:MAG: phage tail tape measure protein, partial [Bacteroidaceae bacterium]|nr:phage tail tape measure protein [Bacteroidaceae bacterium]
MSDTRDTASLFLKVNSEEAKREFETVKSKVEELKKKLIEASNAGDFKQVQELQKQLRPAIKEMNNALTKVGQIESAMKHLSLQSEKDLKKTKNLIISMMNEIPRGTKQWDEYNEKLKQVKAELKKLADEQKVVTDSGLSMKDMLDIGGNLSMIAASVLQVKDSVAEFMRDNVNSYIELDAEMANVQKFTGMTRQSVEELNEEFKKIDTRTSVVELNKLAEEAGRLGKTSKEDVLGFVKAADIINVALDDLGEGATLEISKLTSIFGDEKALGTEKSMLAVGSVINELSQNCTAAAPYLANFTKRLAGVGSQADMTIPQIMGFAAVLDSQGQAVEMSATAVSQLITKMFQDPAKIAKAVGLDVQEFTNMVKTDTNTALLTLLERLNAMGNMDVLAPIFKEMGTDGARASAVLASLAGNVDMVRQQQEVATEAYKEATSVVKEFSVQNETEGAKLEKKRKKLEEVKVALGEKLLPIMGGFTSTGTKMIKMLNALLDIFNKYKSTIMLTGSAVLLYTGYIKAKNFITAKEITLEKAKLF